MTLRRRQRSARRGTGQRSDPRRFLCSCSFLLLLAGCEFRRPPEEGNGANSDVQVTTASEIVEMLQSSARAWNAGDLYGFLDDYWQSEDLTFSGPTGVTRGWEGVRDRYLASYWAPEAARDSLRFESLEVRPLGPDHALTLGRYVLYRPEEEGRVTSSGFFSLVLERMGMEWRIVHDHTSSAADGSESGG